VSHWQHKVCFASCLFIYASLAAPAIAQEQASLQPASVRTKDEAAPTPTPKPKKVWTEDSIAGVRTPADNYLDSKAAAQASAQTASTDPATASSPKDHKGPGAPPLVLHIPKTAEETQQAIDQRNGMADNFHNLLSNAQDRLQTETDPRVRATLTEKANLLLLDINTTNSEIKTLEKALEDYKNGKTPAQPKADGEANTSDSAKQTAQTTAGKTPQ
jgi:hypothetical protein